MRETGKRGGACRANPSGAGGSCRKRGWAGGTAQPRREHPAAPQPAGRAEGTRARAAGPAVGLCWEAGSRVCRANSRAVILHAPSQPSPLPPPNRSVCPGGHRSQGQKPPSALQLQLGASTTSSSLNLLASARACFPNERKMVKQRCQQKSWAVPRTGPNSTEPGSQGHTQKRRKQVCPGWGRELCPSERLHRPKTQRPLSRRSSPKRYGGRARPLSAHS